MSETDIEKLYSPHLWTKRLPTSEILSKHIEFITKESKLCTDIIPNQLNVSYGLGDNEKYDIFGTDLPDDSLILIFVHGGYWQEKSINRKTSRYVANQMYKNSHKSIIIGYDLCPDVNLQTIIKEVHDALIKCLIYAKAFKSRGVYLVGHSVGCHLIAMFFYDTFNTIPQDDQEIIKQVFLFGGLYDLTPLLSTSFNLALGLNDQTTQDLSPMHLNLLAPKHLKFYIIAAEFDSPAFVEQSKQFYEKLCKNQFKTAFKLIANVDHFELIERLMESEYEVTKLILSLI